MHEFRGCSWPQYPSVQKQQTGTQVTVVYFQVTCFRWNFFSHSICAIFGDHQMCCSAECLSNHQIIMYFCSLQLKYQLQFITTLLISIPTDLSNNLSLSLVLTLPNNYTVNARGMCYCTPLVNELKLILHACTSQNSTLWCSQRLQLLSLQKKIQNPQQSILP